MTDKDREKWDSRYLKDMGDSDPSLILKAFLDLVPCGNALDIACGNGRNSLFLAEKGFIVDAVDISIVATNHLAGRNPYINVICQDIDAWKIPQNRYELVVNVRFLDRRLFPMIKDGLRPCGWRTMHAIYCWPARFGYGRVLMVASDEKNLKCSRINTF